MDSLAFLQKPHTAPQPVYVLHGDEDFLKRQVLATLQTVVLGDEPSPLGLSRFAGDTATWATVHDELHTLPFLSPRRLIVIDNADPFVTRHRAALEKYMAQPAALGVLALDVKTWPANTRLAKLVPPAATLGCKALETQRLPPWCVTWAETRYGKTLAAGAARLLVELIGQDMGQLDQELAKLASYVGTAKTIEAKAVDQLVGRSRTENTWKIFDAIGTGRTGEALAILGRLFDQGDEPMKVLGAFSLQLRRLAQAAHLSARGASLSRALEQVGVPPFAIKGCEQQLRHLGRERADRLYDWLVETNLGLRGGSQLPPRTLLERFVIRLARK
jgi:DNA polymerase-3 subunit delta